MAGQPAGWALDLTAGATVERDATVVFSGIASLKYTNPDNASNGGWHGIRTNDPTLGKFCLPLRPGQVYRIRIAARVSSITGTPKYRMLLYHNVAESNSQNKEITFLAANTWEQAEWTFTVPLTAEAQSSLLIELNRNGQAGTYNFYLDSARIIEQEIGAQGGDELANNGRLDLVLNGDFESGLAWWGDEGTSVASIETGVDRYKGARSLKITHGAGGSERVYQVNDFADTTSPQGKRIRVRVQPADGIVFTVAAKVSGAGMQVQMGTRWLDDDLNLVSEDLPSQLVFTSTSWTEKTVTRDPLTGVYYIEIFFLTSGASAGTGWVDEVRIRQQIYGDGLQNRSIAGVKLKLNSVNAGELGFDFADGLRGQNPENLVLNGNAEYRIYAGDTQGGGGTYTDAPDGFWGSSGALGFVTVASAHKGNYSLAITDNTSTVVDAYQVLRPGGNATGNDKVFVLVEPGSVLYFRGVGKLSAATGHVLRFGVAEFDDKRATVSLVTVLSWTTETAFTAKEGFYTVPAGVYYVTFWLRTDVTTGTGANQLLDELYVYETPTRKGLADGTEALPSLTFGSDPDTGIQHATANTFQLVAGGTNQATVTTNGVGFKIGGSTVFGGRPTFVGQLTGLTTSSTTEVELGAISLPANALSANGDAIRISLLGRHSGASAAGQIRVRFGATEYVLTMASLGATDASFKAEIIIARLLVDQQQSVAVGHWFEGADATEITTVNTRGMTNNMTEDDGAAIAISFRGNRGGASGSLALDWAVVEFLRF